MEIWLDSSNFDLVGKAYELGFLHGVTTNPSIVAASGYSLEDLLERLLDLQDGPIAIQVVADDEKEMIRQAELITAHSPRVIIKIPVNEAGLHTMSKLTAKNIPVMATAIFEPYQALLAFKIGAHYLAPYVGKMDDVGLDPEKVLTSILKMKTNYGFEGKIIAAGVRDIHTVSTCLELGIDAITLKSQLFDDLFADHTATKEALALFTREWERAEASEWIPTQTKA